MARKKPVNTTIQVVMSIFIPILWFLACYRIEKLRAGIFIFVVISAELSFVLYYIDDVVEKESLFLFHIGNFEFDVFHVLSIAHAAVFGYIIFRWSKQWNEKVSTNFSIDGK